MPPKKQVKYHQVPKPVDEGCNRVKCHRCGTDARYEMEDMLNHNDWCALAKEEQKKAAAAQAKGKNNKKKNH